MTPSHRCRSSSRMGAARRPSSWVRRRIPQSTTAVSSPQAVTPLARMASHVHGMSAMDRLLLLHVSRRGPRSAGWQFAPADAATRLRRSACCSSAAVADHSAVHASGATTVTWTRSLALIDPVRGSSTWWRRPWAQRRFRVVEVATPARPPARVRVRMQTLGVVGTAALVLDADGPRLVAIGLAGQRHVAAQVDEDAVSACGDQLLGDDVGREALADRSRIEAHAGRQGDGRRRLVDRHAAHPGAPRRAARHPVRLRGVRPRSRSRRRSRGRASTPGRWDRRGRPCPARPHAWTGPAAAGRRTRAGDRGRRWH